MRKPLVIILALISPCVLTLVSCSKEKNYPNPHGVETTIKGHVSDPIRGLNISGYKIVLVKSAPFCANFMCGTRSEEVASTLTDSNGDYIIKFDYNLNQGESYGISEQYYGNPYYPEYPAGKSEIKAGNINVLNIDAWEPIRLTLNIDVLNNNHPSLNVRAEFGTNKILDATEFIYEQNTKKVYSLRSKPNSNINIIFWYYTGTNASPVLHQKTIPFRTTLAPVTPLNFTIDCSTF
ncbi:MAG: hypothetical protein K0S09_1984 [Sphingobacteriaceae bacterium]|jgi:hypothetical protein|nr:hypothetical protein [Sphingobacteriaceae bacterium]